MTNTLHRYGDAASFRDDYVVFAICSRGKNDQNAVPRLRRFLELALQFGPVNLGDARHGGGLRPSRSMNPLAHWRRNTKPDFRAVIEGLDTATTAAAVFDNRAAAEDLMKAVTQVRRAPRTDQRRISRVSFVSTDCRSNCTKHIDTSEADDLSYCTQQRGSEVP